VGGVFAHQCAHNLYCARSHARTTNKRMSDFAVALCCARCPCISSSHTQHSLAYRSAERRHHVATGTKNRKSMSVGATPIAWTPPSATPSSPSSPNGGNGAISCNGGGGGTSGDSGGGGSSIRHAHSLPADVVGGGSGGGGAAAAAVIPTLDFLEEDTEDVFLNSPEVCVYTAHRIAHLSSH
jgi:hypothetical protein